MRSLLLGLIFMSLWTPASAGNLERMQFVRTERFGAFTVKVFSAGDNYIIDINTTDLESTDQSVKYFQASEDITPKIVFSPPIVDIVYLFVDVAADRQCIIKNRFDLMLANTGQSYVAFSAVPNEICPDLGIIDRMTGLTDLFSFERGYSRLLTIIVRESRDNLVPALERGREWASIEFHPSEFSNSDASAVKFNDFILANTNGTFNIVDAALAPSKAEIRGVVSLGGRFIGDFTIGRTTLLRLASDRPYVTSAIAAALLAMTFVLTCILRRRRPTRHILVGYGSKCDYSVGPGPDRPLARISLYKNGRIRVRNLDRDSEILINGRQIGRGGWLTQRDRIQVGGRNIEIH